MSAFGKGAAGSLHIDLIKTNIGMNGLGEDNSKIIAEWSTEVDQGGRNECIFHIDNQANIR